MLDPAVARLEQAAEKARASAAYALRLGHKNMDGISAANFALQLGELAEEALTVCARVRELETARDAWRDAFRCLSDAGHYATPEARDDAVNAAVIQAEHADAVLVVSRPGEDTP